ncbi:MAG: hypothetical protein AAF696_26845 [Bacteroidota bacterium]
MKTLKKKMRCVVISIMLGCLSSKSLFGQIQADRQQNTAKYSHQSDKYAEQYLFAPSAIPMKKGSIRYKNLALTVNSLSLGISDQLSLDVGVELWASTILITSREGGLLSYANLKFRHSLSDNLHLGLGLFAGEMLSVSDNRHAAYLIPYTLSTFGNPNYNLTLGLGFLPNNKVSPSLIMLNGTAKIAPTFSLISENYLSLFKQDANSFVGEGRSGNVVITLLLRHYRRIGHFDLGLGHSYSFWSRAELVGSPTVPFSNGGNWLFRFPIPMFAFSLNIR